MIWSCFIRISYHFCYNAILYIKLWNVKAQSVSDNTIISNFAYQLQTDCELIKMFVCTSNILLQNVNFIKSKHFVS